MLHLLFSSWTDLPRIWLFDSFLKNCYTELNGDPQNICPWANPQGPWMLLHLEKVFADVIKDAEMKRSPWVIQATANPLRSVLLRERQRVRWKRPRHMGGGDVKKEADTGGMWPKAKSRGLCTMPDSGSHGRIRTWDLRGRAALATPHCQTVGLQNCGRINVCCSNRTKWLLYHIQRLWWSVTADLGNEHN